MATRLPIDDVSIIEILSMSPFFPMLGYSERLELAHKARVSIINSEEASRSKGGEIQDREA